jgi:succinoglycan biosynthesis protein ExoM
MRVTVMIPTQRRLDGLAVAARSVFAQTGVDFAGLELVVVDNDQAPSAQATAATTWPAAPFPVHYVHEPRPAWPTPATPAWPRPSGELIAFLDDDEEAPTGWLAALLDAQAAIDADVVFGPVKSPRAGQRRRASRLSGALLLARRSGRGGIIDHYYGCGDSLLRRAALPDPVAPFAVERNHIGGEDDMLFGHMQAGGARFAWEPAAWVWEDPVPDRLSLDYTIRRAFAYGQGPSAHCAAASPPDRLGVARWMAVGVGSERAVRTGGRLQVADPAKDRADWLDRAARGLGKTLWWGPFKIHFYGRTVS